jgi:uncharacterized UPF0160 family protein
MGLFTKTPTIAVHDGKFHADDIFACATINLMLGTKAKVIRTRDEMLIAKADYVADVGNVYDPAQRRFDHHMREGAGARANGIPYAAFGLVWKEYGEKVCGSKAVADRIDARLVAPIDAEDNGMSIYDPKGETLPFTIQQFFYLHRPTWKESEELYDEAFPKLVALAEEVLIREIEIQSDILEATDIVERAYVGAVDKRLIVLDVACPHGEILASHPEPLLVVSPRRGSTNWGVGLVSAGTHLFETRMKLPEAWAGLRDEEFAKVTGVSDAVFCHRALFLAVAKSKEGALALAKLALISNTN